MHLSRTFAISAALAIVGVASADVTFDLGVTINGSTPTGSAPFLTAVFHTVTTGSVMLTMTNNMPTTNFVPVWVFNLDPFTSLTATYQSGNQATVSSGLNFTNGANDLKGGLFDLKFEYPVSNADPNRFKGGENSVYLLTGSGLTAEKFASKSVADGGNLGGYYSAAKVQGFGSSGSIGTNTVVPEPATMAALGLGVAGLIRRRKRSKN